MQLQVPGGMFCLCIKHRKMLGLMRLRQRLRPGSRQRKCSAGLVYALHISHLQEQTWLDALEMGLSAHALLAMHASEDLDMANVMRQRPQLRGRCGPCLPMPAW